VTNFLNWSSATVPQALKAVTATPAALLGLGNVKGSLNSDADADLVVIDEIINRDGSRKLVIDQVWKFGTKVHDRLQNA
jgi:N-acetylglucosamine-6-phosphate deacetylase